MQAGVPHERRERLRIQDGHRERHRLGQCEHAAHAGHLPDGHPGVGQEHLPVQHPGPAHLVRDPREQGRLHGPPRGHRSRRGAQHVHVRPGRRGRAPRRIPALRLIVAARCRSACAKTSRFSASRSGICASRTSRATARAPCCRTSCTRARSPRCSASTWTSSARCCARSSPRRSRSSTPTSAPSRWATSTRSEHFSARCPSTWSGWTPPPMPSSSTATRPPGSAPCTPARPWAPGTRSRRPRR